jgi:hypothetical protein
MCCSGVVEWKKLAVLMRDNKIGSAGARTLLFFFFFFF